MQAISHFVTQIAVRLALHLIPLHPEASCRKDLRKLVRNAENTECHDSNIFPVFVPIFAWWQPPLFVASVSHFSNKMKSINPLSCKV